MNIVTHDPAETESPSVNPDAGALAWRHLGSCRGYPAQWWETALTKDKQGGRNNQVAIDICHGCPVRRQCLEYGLRTRSMGFIWGGVVLSQRLSAKAIEVRHCVLCDRLYAATATSRTFCSRQCRAAAARASTEAIVAMAAVA